MKRARKMLRAFENTIKLQVNGRKTQMLRLWRWVLSRNPCLSVLNSDFTLNLSGNSWFVTFISLSSLVSNEKISVLEYVSLLLVVPKRPLTMYRLALDFRSFTATKGPTFWPVPNIKSDLLYTGDSNAFTSIELCIGYWKAPLHPESHPLFTFSTPHGTVTSFRTTQVACNSAANFQ